MADVIDKTLQTTRSWLAEIQDRLHTNDSSRAYTALEATLHAVRDRLGPRNVTALGEQLPLLIRGIYYQGWRPLAQPAQDQQLQDFVNLVNGAVGGAQPAGGSAPVHAVLEVLCRHLPPEGTKRIELAFPSELRRLWRAPQAAA